MEVTDELQPLIKHDTSRGVVVSIGGRRFTSETVRTSHIWPEIWIMPDGKRLPFDRGFSQIGPMRWIEIDSDGNEMGEVKASYVFFGLPRELNEAARPWWKKAIRL